MTQIIDKQLQASSLRITLKGKNLLWWYGDFLLLTGLLFWIIALNQELLVTWLDWFQASDLELVNDGAITAQFMFALAGALIMGWGIAIMAIAADLSETSRRYLLASFVVWFAFDSIASFLFEFYVNMAFNLLFLGSAVIVAYITLTKEELAKRLTRTETEEKSDVISS